MDIIAFMASFMRDGRTQMLFAAIAVDVVTGVMCAIRAGHFNFVRFGQFYRTNVIPFVLGWLLIYAFSSLGLSSLVGEQWGGLVAYAGYVPALVALGKSITENLDGLRSAAPPPETYVGVRPETPPESPPHV